MVIEQGSQVTTEMFRPARRSRRTEEDYEGLLRYFYGDAGQEFAEGLKVGRLNSAQVPQFRERIDPFFRRVFARRFPHAADATGQSTYLEAQRTARGVVKHVISQVYPQFNDDIFANEVALESPSPTDFLYYLVKEDDGVIASYERRRHFLLTLGAAEIDSASGNGDMARQLMDINRLFDDELFVRGSRRQVSVVAYHDAKTYGVRRMDLQRPKQVPHDVLLREHQLTLREIEGVGLVQTRIRQKEPATGVIKMFAYAANGDGIFDPSSVKDPMGFTLITIEDSPSQSSGDRVELLINKSEGLLREFRAISRIEKDDITGDSRGQGGVVLRRRQVYLADLPEYPLEVMYYRGEDYLTQAYEVGEIDPKTGFYNGRAYKLYSLRRLESVFPSIRPEEIYGGDPRRDLINRTHAVADEIRNSGFESREASVRGRMNSTVKSLARKMSDVVRYFR